MNVVALSSSLGFAVVLGLVPLGQTLFRVPIARLCSGRIVTQHIT